MSALLTSAAEASDHQPNLQRWLDTPTARVRATTWQAVGMVMYSFRAAPADALDVLRARAYSTGRLVDDAARDVLSGQLPVAELA